MLPGLTPLLEFSVHPAPLTRSPLLIGAATWEPEQYVPARIRHFSSLNLTNLQLVPLVASKEAAEHPGKNAGSVSKSPAERQFVFFLKKGSLEGYIKPGFLCWDLFQLQLERFFKLFRVSGKGLGISCLVIYLEPVVGRRAEGPAESSNWVPTDP